MAIRGTVSVCELASNSREDRKKKKVNKASNSIQPQLKY
jgi:hypothetical protein